MSPPGPDGEPFGSRSLKIWGPSSNCSVNFHNMKLGLFSVAGKDFNPNLVGGALSINVSQCWACNIRNPYGSRGYSWCKSWAPRSGPGACFELLSGLPLLQGYLAHSPVSISSSLTVMWRLAASASIMLSGLRDRPAPGYAPLRWPGPGPLSGDIFSDSQQQGPAASFTSEEGDNIVIDHSHHPVHHLGVR